MTWKDFSANQTKITSPLPCISRALENVIHIFVLSCRVPGHPSELENGVFPHVLSLETHHVSVSCVYERWRYDIQNL